MGRSTANRSAAPVEARPALLHRRFPPLVQTLPRLPICELPTPTRELPELAASVGGDSSLWLKDDGRTAAPWGGNKPRKLEWTLAEARRRRCGTVLTFGATATNHGLATALYARRHGLRCVLALVDQPWDEHVRAQLERNLSAATRVYRTGSTARTVLALPYLLARHAQLRPPRTPYLLPPGGSSPLGAVGFVEAALELAAQVEGGELPEPDAVYVPLGSGGTAAGLLAGLRVAGLRTRVVAILVNDKLRLSAATVTRLARRTLALLRRRGAELPEIPLRASDVEVPTEWLGAGYGHRTPAAEEAARLASEVEGLALEPVYTAKAMAALLARARTGRMAGPALYWHTHSSADLDGSQNASSEG